MGVVTFNGVHSNDLHILVQHPPEYAFPERDYETEHVPGRNGDIIIDNGTWRNVERTYQLAIDARRDEYVPIASRLVSWLHGPSGYCRLEDSYEPDYYRMAMYKDGGTISNIMNKAGEIDITFDCKPQRYLKSGNKVIERHVVAHGDGHERLIITNSNVIEMYNPTPYLAYPEIELSGIGSSNVTIYRLYDANQTFSKDGDVEYITLGTQPYEVYTIAFDGVTTVIDSERRDVYSISDSGGYINKNRIYSVAQGVVNPSEKDPLYGYNFPRLAPGLNKWLINRTSNPSEMGVSIKIKPRWWVL